MTVTPASTDVRTHHTTRRAARARRTEWLVLRLRAATSGPESREIQDDLTACNLPVAHAVAGQYGDRGVPAEDLEQVAGLALVKATRRFDPFAGFDYLSYCVPSVRGEVRRYFRDQGWTIRPPRRIQELQREIGLAQSALGHRSGRDVSASEIARHLDRPAGEVREAMALQGAFAPASLDRPVTPASETSLGDLLGGPDAGQDGAEARVVLSRVLHRLGERDRHILALRFYEGCTQQEIADDIGVTQMQVSRLLSRIFADLRHLLGDPDRADMVD